MKIAGIITEYNPFHNGHAYQIEKVRQETGSDYVVIVMSGDFVQRGNRLYWINMCAHTWLWKMALIWCWNFLWHLPAPEPNILPEAASPF